MLTRAAAIREVTLIARGIRKRANLAAAGFRLRCAPEFEINRAPLKLIANAETPTANVPAGSPQSARGNFRNRYDDLEARREQLMARLSRLGESAKVHRGHKRAHFAQRHIP